MTNQLIKCVHSFNFPQYPQTSAKAAKHKLCSTRMKILTSHYLLFQQHNYRTHFFYDLLVVEHLLSHFLLYGNT